GHVFSAEYNAASWSVVGEYFDLETDLGDLIPWLPGMVANGKAYYLQGIYRFHPGWDAFVRYDVQYSLETAKDDWQYYAKDITLGLGWRPASDWLIRTEWHNVNGTSWVSMRETSWEDRVQRWQMVLFQISYRI